MTTTAPIPEETRRTFLEALDLFGKESPEERQKGELGLNQITCDMRTQLALITWESYRKSRLRREYSGFIMLALAAAASFLSPIIFFTLSTYLRLNEHAKAVLLIINFTPTFIIVGWSNKLSNREVGNARLLAMLDSPTVVPELLEVTSGFNPKHDLRVGAIHVTIRQRLMELIPRFLSGDHPDLSDRHQRMIRAEFKWFANRFRRKGIPLADWETDYLIALLGLLRLPDREKERKATHDVLESMANLNHPHTNSRDYFREMVQETQARLSVGAGSGAKRGSA